MNHLLTPREKQAAMYAASGFDNEKVAAQMGIKKATVEQYLHRVYDKAQVDRPRLAAVLKVSL